MHRFPTLLRGELAPVEPDESGKGPRRAQTAENMYDSRSTQASDEGSGSIPRSRTMPGFPADLGAEYPVDLKVRNTFLHFPQANRPESWDDCLELRQVRSAPGSRLLNDNPADDFGESPLPEVPAEQQQAPAVLDLSSILSKQAQALGAHGYSEARSQQPSTFASQKPEIGSTEIPTVGSVGHGAGHCKPCAFVWKGDGCSNGVQCPFCHLCDPGEKKRRSKDKKIHIRSQRSSGGAGGAGQGFGSGRLSQTFRSMLGR